jgi:hypothetical protein
MLAVKGMYDGQEIKLTGPHLPHDPQPVIVTFLGSESETINDDILALAAKGKSFEFLAGEEDLYSDSDLKARYK